MAQFSLFASPPTLSVSELTRHIRRLIEDDGVLQNLWVQGELSNFSRPASGHLYFTLKDTNAALKCVMWRNLVLRQSFIPRDGSAVEVHGAVNVYEAGGQYQLYVDLIRPAGEGQLYQEFLRLKTRLEAEGLFDPARKRPIPRWPKRIGIITSPTGAALRDMLNTLRRRYPLAEVILAPTPVQGEEAPARIVAALQALNDVAHPDVILVARGGGSIEDLSAFNDERVARAIAASAAPIITGVGHETDFTIADFVADLRAPTPTAAAELATPQRDDLLAALADMAGRLERTARSSLSGQRWQFANLQHRLRLHSPQTRLRSDRQRLDEMTRWIETALRHKLQLHTARLAGTKQRLSALNPLAVLERGFAVVVHTDGRIVRRLSQIHPGDPLSVRVSDGSFDVVVAGKA